MTKLDGFSFTDVKSHDAFVDKMKKFLETKAKRKHILKPVNGSLKVRLIYMPH
jgi:hypothetical protein